MRITAIEILAGLVALGSTGLAMAAPCYVILDRNDTVIYRDAVPPFDLSTSGSPEQKVLRQRGQHLLIAEFERCNAVGYISPTTGGTAATVDEIVMDLKPAISTSIGSSGGAVTSSPASAATPPSAPARVQRPAAAAAPRY